LATPCLACHKKGEDWKFRGLDKNCSACHENIHKNFIDPKFIPEGRCDKCHTVNDWVKVTFDHKITTFELKGKHAEASCRDCHFKKVNSSQVTQVFSDLKPNCESCHTDVHQKQFSANGSTNCAVCHGFDNWKAERFDHNKTRFKLDGGHKNVDCRKCHHQNNSTIVPFIKYKNTDRQCTSCHI